jgi:3-hydroxyisobutyrate dehydrogenase
MTNNISPPEQVGFIGIGNMGAPMAHLLTQAGYRLYITDKSAAAVEDFAATHPACETPADLPSLGAACNVVITMLPNGQIVREVLLGDGGVADGLAAGAMVIDMSSSSAVGTRQLHAELAQRNIQLIDAPVSGGVKKAVDGSLAIMAGGAEAAVKYCQPLLQVMGRVFYTGIPGSGHAMKALNNYLSAASLASASEAIMAGKRFGLDPDLMVEILNVSSGRSNSTETKFPLYILNREFNSGFAIGLLAKDLRLAREIAQSTDTPAALLQTCAGLWEQAEAELGFQADHTEIMKYLEALADD